MWKNEKKYVQTLPRSFVRRNITNCFSISNPLDSKSSWFHSKSCLLIIEPNEMPVFWSHGLLEAFSQNRWKTLKSPKPFQKDILVKILSPFSSLYIKMHHWMVSTSKNPSHGDNRFGSSSTGFCELFFWLRFSDFSFKMDYLLILKMQV